MNLIIPAAGLGSRLGSKISKPFVSLKGKPLISYVLEATSDLFDGIVLVVQPGAEKLFALDPFLKKWADKFEFRTQTVPSGSWDAVRIGLRNLSGDSVVIWADQVGLNKDSVNRVIDSLSAGNELVVPLAEIPHPYVWYELDKFQNISTVFRERDGLISPPIGFTDLGLFGLGKSATNYILNSALKHPTGSEADFIYCLPEVAQAVKSLDCFIIHNQDETISINSTEDMVRALNALG